MSREVLVKILDLARWAPSGDNTQPWRFEIVDELERMSRLLPSLSLPRPWEGCGRRLCHL